MLLTHDTFVYFGKARTYFRGSKQSYFIRAFIPDASFVIFISRARIEFFRQY